ncbi:hypothetical protein B296_00014654, partial [Ensete ventricosum]
RPNTWVRAVYPPALGGSTAQSTQIPRYGQFNRLAWVGHSRSRSRSPTPISLDPRPWSSLFKAPVGSLDLRLDFFAPEVQADQKIAMYETADSDELIETWSMAIVGYMVGLRTFFIFVILIHQDSMGISAFDLHILENIFFMHKLYYEEDLQRVLEGFWTIRGHPMILQRSAPDVRLKS